MTSATRSVTNGHRPSLVESTAARIAASAGRRREARARRPLGVLAFCGEMLGTIAALACFVIAAFAAGFLAGMIVSGVALLLADFKIDSIRRRKAPS